MRVSPDVSCASRSGRQIGPGREPVGGRGSPRRNAQPIRFVGPLDFDLHGLRRADDPRADVGEVLGDQHERDVGRQQRRIGRPLLDEHAHGAIFGARLRRPIRESASRRTGTGSPRRATAARWTTCFRNESSSEKNAAGSRGSDRARSVPWIASTTATASVKCLCDSRRVEDRAVGALVFDHHVALAEHPVGQERRSAARSRAAGAALSGGLRHRRRDRACCRAARTCCRAARGCRAPACAPSAGSASNGAHRLLRLPPRVRRRLGSRSAPGRRRRLGSATRRRQRRRSSPPVSDRSSASISRTTRSESSDCRTMVSSSCGDGLRIAHRDRVLVQHFEQRGHRVELGRQRLDGVVGFRAATSAAGASARGSSRAPPRARSARSASGQLLLRARRSPARPRPGCGRPSSVS